MLNLNTAGTEHNVPILRLEGITKRFGNLVANDNISLSIAKGEVHVLFGENGAGKSTLSNIIYGYMRPDEGSMFINGEKVHFKSPRDASAYNIGMVHQHFMLVPTLSGMKNILLGLDYGKGSLLDIHHAEERIKDLCTQYSVQVDLNKEVWKLSVGEQQWIEILKALFLGSQILILDEPTSVLTPQEVETLLDRIIDMKRAGITIIMVSHKLKEIDKVSDRISVLRRGHLIGTVETAKVSRKELIEMMIGRNYDLGVDKRDANFGKPVLEVDDVSACNNDKIQTLHNISFNIREGEIFGIAGVAGNGQTDLYEVITGLRAQSSGKVKVDGSQVCEGIDFKSWHALNVAEIPEDRIEKGSVGSMTLEENILLGNHREKKFIKYGMLNWQVISDMAKKRIQEYDVRPNDLKYQARALSGGNLQKLLLSRELTKSPRLIVAAQPTRGLDVIAVEFIWNRLLDERDKGAACLLISEDLDELIALSDRIGVLYNGEIVGIFDGEFPINEIGELMIKGRNE